jgi:hypothetical protein
MATGTGRSARSHGLSSWATRWTNMQTKGDREWLPAATVDPVVEARIRLPPGLR